LQQLIDVKVLSTETIRPDCYAELQLDGDQTTYQSSRWREELAPGANVLILARDEFKQPAVVQQGNVVYVGTLSCEEFLIALFRQLAESVGLPMWQLGSDLRTMQRGQLQFVFNYGATMQQFTAPENAEFVIGSSNLQPYDVAVLRLS
jgi:beta-galactosidase